MRNPWRVVETQDPGLVAASNHHNFEQTSGEG